jgi:hypothetical protein
MREDKRDLMLLTKLAVAVSPFLSGKSSDPSVVDQTGEIIVYRAVHSDRYIAFERIVVEPPERLFDLLACTLVLFVVKRHSLVEIDVEIGSRNFTLDFDQALGKATSDGSTSALGGVGKGDVSRGRRELDKGQRGRGRGARGYFVVIIHDCRERREEKRAK